jgi:hypothetical protein
LFPIRGNGFSTCYRSALRSRRHDDLAERRPAITAEEQAEILQQLRGLPWTRGDTSTVAKSVKAA